jgi:hypothetical protein
LPATKVAPSSIELGAEDHIWLCGEGGMALKADFIKDVAVRCTDMLAAAGYSFPPGDDWNAIRTYASVRRRRIPTRPRTVHRAPYSVPAHLTAGEQQLTPATSGPREGGDGGEPPAPKSATPPRGVFEPREGVVRISTGEPDRNSPLGYCEIGHWKLNASGELVLRNESGALLREHRLEHGQDPAAMALKLLRAWWMADRKSDFGRVLRYGSDDWMA